MTRVPRTAIDWVDSRGVAAIDFPSTSPQLHDLVMDCRAGSSLSLSQDGRIIVASGSTFSSEHNEGTAGDTAAMGFSRVWDVDSAAVMDLPDDTVCGDMVAITKADPQDLLEKTLGKRAKGAGVALPDLPKGYFIISCQGRVLRLAFLAPVPGGQG